MRCDIGCHAYRNTAGAVDDQIREAGRKYAWFLLFTVIVVIHVYRVLVEVSDHFQSDLRHSGFGITHGGCTVSVHRAEVAVSVNQHTAHVPGLSHVYHGTVDRAVTVRVVFSHRITDDTRTLSVRLVRCIAHLVHRVQNSSLYRLQSVSYIGKRS